MKATKEDFKAVACPKCSAEVGVQCTRSNGKNGPFKGWAHKERVMLVRYGLMPDEVMQVAQQDMTEHIRQLLTQIPPDSPFTCCDFRFGDMAAFDRHISRGHLEPTALGLIFRADGWSSR